MTETKFNEMENDSTKKTIGKFIVNGLGINLCSVDSIEVDEKDGQIKEINIKFAT